MADIRRCDCESSDCHPKADCQQAATVKTIHSTICESCAAQMPEEYLAWKLRALSRSQGGRVNYTITIDETERQILANAFGILARKLSTCTPVIDSASGTDQARAILAPPSSPSARPSGQTTPAAAPSPAPIEQRDRWAKDRKGKEVPNPEGSEPIEIQLSKTEQKEKFLRVSWQNSGQGYGNANCFDKALWPHIIGRTGQKTRLYITRKGEYVNVVGVRA